MSANPSFTDPDQILPGQAVAIPAATTSTPGVPTTGGNGGQTYTVTPGDTLTSIAKRFNTSTAALMSANTWISNPNLIIPGWVINIP